MVWCVRQEGTFHQQGEEGMKRFHSIATVLAVIAGLAFGGQALASSHGDEHAGEDAHSEEHAEDEHAGDEAKSRDDEKSRDDRKADSDEHAGEEAESGESDEHAGDSDW
jgi:hypothetical protein